MTNTIYKDAVAELAALAGANAMSHFRTSLVPETKGDGSPVTIADQSSERLARDWIEKRFPADGILGEEFGVVRPEAPRRWIIDPIDGTKAFVRAIPFWGTLVAVMEGDSVIAGAAEFPALGESLVAAPGEGCWWNGNRCGVSTVSDLASATVLTTDAAFNGHPAKLEGWQALAARSGTSRTWGDCVGYLLVATGRAEAMVDPVVSAWDIAALIPAITEAGGVFTDWEGRTTCGTTGIATNAALADAVRAILNPGREASQP